MNEIMCASDFNSHLFLRAEKVVAEALLEIRKQLPILHCQVWLQKQKQ